MLLSKVLLLNVFHFIIPFFSLIHEENSKSLGSLEEVYFTRNANIWYSPIFCQKTKVFLPCLLFIFPNTYYYKFRYIFCLQKEAFNNYVDIISPFFDHLPSSRWTVFTLHVDNNEHFFWPAPTSSCPRSYWMAPS